MKLSEVLLVTTLLSLVDIQALWHRANVNKRNGVNIGTSTYIMLVTDILFVLLLSGATFLVPGVAPLWGVCLIAIVGYFLVRFLLTAINAVFIFRVRRKAESAASAEVKKRVDSYERK